MATYTLKTRENTRVFWCPSDGGYVREIDDAHPGTLGKQGSDSLNYVGNMLYARAETLAQKIRLARRRERRIIAQENEY